MEISLTGLDARNIPGLRELIAEELSKAFAAHQKLIKKGIREDGMMNVKEAAEYLGLAHKSLYVMECNNIIPCHKRGAKVFFNKTEMDEWNAAGRPANPDPALAPMDANLAAANKMRRKRKW